MEENNMKCWIDQSLKIGTLATVPHFALAEVIKTAGFDWVWIDAEHGGFDENSAAAYCAVNAGGPKAFIRVPDTTPATIKRYLDTGCDGLIFPQVNSREDMEEIGRWALYPPQGQRSVGIARAQGYGSRLAEALKARTYALIPQIETAAGVGNIEAILGVECVDAVLIGPYDLSGSFGVPGDVSSPHVVESIASVLKACKKAMKPCGIFAGRPEAALGYVQQGFDLIAVGIDTMTLLNSYTALLAHVRKKV